jgi:hypothetical protein
MSTVGPIPLDTLIQALSLVAGLLDYALHPERHRANQAWKDTAATLSAEERREVSRAVRGGTAVSDPSLPVPPSRWPSP